jgi:hypothetical protein
MLLLNISVPQMKDIWWYFPCSQNICHYILGTQQCIKILRLFCHHSFVAKCGWIFLWSFTILTMLFNLWHWTLDNGGRTLIKWDWDSSLDPWKLVEHATRLDPHYWINVRKKLMYSPDECTQWARSTHINGLYNILNLMYFM